MTVTPLRVFIVTPRPWHRRLAALALLATVYAALALLGLRWATVHGAASPVFPAAGAAVAGLVLGGTRLWPAVFAGALVAFAVSDSAHSWAVEAALAAGNALAAALAAASLQRLRFAPDLSRTRDALALIGIGAIGASAVAATVGTATLWASVPLEAAAARLTWLNWFFGDVVGVLTTAPLLLAWITARPPRRACWWAHLAACSAVTLAVASGVFVFNETHRPTGWYSLVPLLWAAFAFHARGSAIVALVAATAIVGTTTGTGPFATGELGPLRFVLLQQFVAVAAAATLITASLVSERHDQDTLRATRERLGLALSAGRMGVWSYTPSTGQAHWDDTLAQLTGLAAIASVQARTDLFLARIHPEDLPRVLADERRVLADGGRYGHEFRFTRPDGRMVWLASHAAAARDGQGQLKHLTGVSFDITDRRLAEQALRDSEARSRRQLQELDTLYQSAPVGMWLGDRDCRFLRVNEVLAALHGYPVQAHLGRTLRELAPWVADLIEPHYRRVLDTGQPVLGVEIVARVPAQPDAERTWLVSYCPLFGEGHEVSAVSVIVEEITAHKRAQAALLDADRRKDEFLATLAHELRNPLAPIRTGLQLLKRAPASSPSAAAAREMMERQLVHMVRLVDDLLDLSRISRGKIHLRRERLELSRVVEAALEASRPNIEAGRHALVVRQPDQPIFLQADAARLSQVVGNLLNNAAKYTPEGGRIELAASREGGEAVIRVSDTGVGIAPDMLPRVFEIFTQVGRTIDRAQGGLGIGLSLVKRLVELHGGSVRAESPGPGQGSTFTVRLPLAPMRATDQPEPAHERQAAA